MDAAAAAAGGHAAPLYAVNATQQGRGAGVLADAVRISDLHQLSDTGGPTTRAAVIDADDADDGGLGDPTYAVPDPLGMAPALYAVNDSTSTVVSSAAMVELRTLRQLCRRIPRQLSPGAGDSGSGGAIEPCRMAVPPLASSHGTGDSPGDTMMGGGFSQTLRAPGVVRGVGGFGTPMGANGFETMPRETAMATALEPDIADGEAFVTTFTAQSDV